MGTPDAAANYLASRELVTPRRLREFFAPKSIAMVGASDNSGWGRFIVTSCQTTGFSGPLMAVHPRAKTAFGLPVVPSLRDLLEPADLAFILAPVQAVEGALTDMGAAGIKNAVVLASGYREVGDDGRTLENARRRWKHVSTGWPGARPPRPSRSSRSAPPASTSAPTGARC